MGPWGGGLRLGEGARMDKWRRPWGRFAPSMDRGQGLTKYGHCFAQAAEGLTRQSAQLFRGERPRLAERASQRAGTMVRQGGAQQRGRKQGPTPEARYCAGQTVKPSCTPGGLHSDSASGWADWASQQGGRQPTLSMPQGLPHCPMGSEVVEDCHALGHLPLVHQPLNGLKSPPSP